MSYHCYICNYNFSSSDEVHTCLGCGKKIRVELCSCWSGETEDMTVTCGLCGVTMPYEVGGGDQSVCVYCAPPAAASGPPAAASGPPAAASGPTLEVLRMTEAALWGVIERKENELKLIKRELLQVKREIYKREDEQ